MSKNLLENKKIEEAVDEILKLAEQKAAVRNYQVELAKKLFEEADKTTGEIDNLIKRAKELLAEKANL